MNFQIRNERLLPLIKRVTSVVSSKTLLPAFGRIQIASNSPGTVSFYTYSPTIDVVGTLDDIAVPGPFAVGLQVDLFTNLISALPKDAIVSFSLEEASLTVRCASSRYKLNIYRDDVYPPTPPYGQLPNQAEVDMGAFINGLRKVSFCSETQDDRLERMAVCINSDHFVATDGHRMSIYPNRVLSTPYDLLVSSSTVEKAQKLYDKATGPGLFSGSPNGILLFSHGIGSSMRLLAGAYPQYRSVIPTGDYMPCVVKRQPLIEALNRVLLLTGENAKNVDFLFCDNRLELYAADVSQGDGQEVIPSTCRGYEYPVTLTGKYVMEALKSCSGDTVHFEIRSPVIPPIIRDEEHVHVIMPIRPREGS